jgi:hypothetical protein
VSDPPNEKGASEDRARLGSANVASVIGHLREINSAAPRVWVNEGWRLFAEYQNSGRPKHLAAFCRHVAGVRARMAGLRPSTSTEGAPQCTMSRS